MNVQIPESITRLIGNCRYALDDIGKSSARVLCFDDMVLKIGASANEYRMMDWLQGRLPVPKVYAFEAAGGVNYLLMSRVPGDMLCADRILADRQALAQLLATSLKMLWEVDVTGCPANNLLSGKLLEAERIVAQDTCCADDAEPGTFGEGGFETPAHLLDWLRENRPPETPVFSHGDCCLPNIFAQNGAISGFIDLGSSGVADKYQDIALCYRSLVHNTNGKYGVKLPDFRADALFDALGIDPDWEKIKYYILLDELF